MFVDRQTGKIPKSYFEVLNTNALGFISSFSFSLSQIIVALNVYAVVFTTLLGITIIIKVHYSIFSVEAYIPKTRHCCYLKIEDINKIRESNCIEHP